MNIFNFKQFSIIQEKTAMKVGTDGVLLGAWCIRLVMGKDGEKGKRFLDIGTGTGVIALMLAQKFPDAVIDAIEIDHNAAEEAKQNVANSPWQKRINVIESSLQDYGLSELHLYDLIVVNPPFYNSTLKPDDDARATARHSDALPFKVVTKFADKFLSHSGLLAVIYPTNNEENVMLGVADSGLRIIRVCNVCTKVGKLCKRRMLLLGKTSEDGVIHETINLRDADGDYSEEYLQLTEDFYLSISKITN